MTQKLQFRMLGHMRVIPFISDMVPEKQIQQLEEDRLVIFVRDGIPFSIRIDMINVLEDKMVLIAAQSMEIGRIDIEIDKVNNSMRLYNLKREIRIYDLDPLFLGRIDEITLGTEVEGPLELDVRINTLTDDYGKTQLYMQVTDDPDITGIHPLHVGTVDPSAIHVLDPDAVPDSVPASLTEEDEITI